MHLKLVCLLCLVAAAAAQVSHLGAPPDPSKPLSIKTIVGSKYLYKPRHFRLNPEQPYVDQARYIRQHGYHSQYLIEALGDGTAYGHHHPHHHYHRK